MIQQAQLRDYTINTLSLYWVHGLQHIINLPMPIISIPINTADSFLTEIELPMWAEDLGVEGCLLVPTWAVIQGARPKWQRVDWIGAAFWYMGCIPEQVYEANNGSIHSYSFRLKGWDNRIWDRAWVNRIALFLRRWSSFLNNTDEVSLFGTLPEPKIWITHDVDAIAKTLAIRLKQTAFCVYNAFRYICSGNTNRSFEKLSQACRFLLSNENYYYLEQVASLEATHNLRSIFLLYGKNNKRLTDWLFDPGYTIENKELTYLVKRLVLGGWQFGLHQSYSSWQDYESMADEKARVAAIIQSSVTFCRQHWLRFSWQDTWKAQSNAGLTVDFTLGFNDRIGFRNAAALKMHPINLYTGEKLLIESVPMVLMDSHLYDYSTMTEKDRNASMKAILEEVYFVRGQASIIWHPHTLSNDYGWGEGFKQLLSCIPRKV